MSTMHLLISFAFLGFTFFIWISRHDMRKVFYYFMASFDNFSKGASANKMSAFAGIGVSVYVTKRFTDVNNIVNILLVWLLFVLLCFGLITVKNIVELIQSYKWGNQGKTCPIDKPPLDEVLVKKPTDNINPDEIRKP